MTGDARPPGEEGGAPAQPRGRLTSGRLIARNLSFSAAGQVATIVVALAAIPLLVDGLGTARFGILTLAWVVIGYASVFDLGIGRALTKLVAERTGVAPIEEIGAFFWTGLLAMTLLGVAAGGVVAVLSPWLVEHALNVPEDLETEALHAFWVLSAGLPLAIGGAALRGYLEALGRFDLLNAIVIPMSVVTYFGPVLALALFDSLVAVVAAVVVSRAISWVVTSWLIARVTPGLAAARSLRRRALGPLVRFGSWVTVSNVVNALMLAADRFIVGVVLSVTAVAYFATPYEVVIRLWVVAITLAAVFFPAYARSFAEDPGRAGEILRGATRLGFIVLFPVALAGVTLAEEGLDLWLGREFAENSEQVLQWLAVGVIAGSLGQLASTLVQSQRPDLTAKVALVELPLYLLAFWLVLRGSGIEWAAAVWAARAIVDAGVLYALAARVAAIEAAPVLRRLPLVVVPAALALVAGAQLEGLWPKLGFLALAVAAFAPLAWRGILGPDERGAMRRLAPMRGAA